MQKPFRNEWFLHSYGKLKPMKNIFATFFISSFFIFSACKKSSVENSEALDQKTIAQNFVTDSVVVNDSIKISDSLSLKYTAKLLVFPTIKDKKLLDSIYFNNKGIKDYSRQGIQAYLEKERDGYYYSVKNDSKDWLSGLTYSQKWYTNSLMSLKSHLNDYIHIQYMGSAYEGGAHDNYGFSERVFDLKKNKKIELKDITSIPQKKLEELLMKNLDNIHSGTTDSEGKVKNSEMLLVEMIPVTENFYFDDKNLYFHYSPFEIAAFAAGDIVIPVPWQELKGTLKPEFKERMKIK